MSRRMDIFHDVQGICFGIVMLSLGVVFLKACGLVTGQLAGLAVLISFIGPLPFGAVFFALNLPFYALSWKKRGPGFTLRTLVSVAGISVLTPLFGRMIAFEAIPVPLGALLAGCCSAIGLIALFRHKASAGGVGILALWLEETRGIKAGWVQMGFDAGVFLLAALVLPVHQLFWSLAGAVVLNLLIAWNFRLPTPARP